MNIIVVVRYLNGMWCGFQFYPRQLEVTNDPIMAYSYPDMSLAKAEATYLSSIDKHYLYFAHRITDN